MAAKVGSLNVDLTLGTARFTSGLTDAQKSLAASQKKFEAIGSKLEGIGAKLSLGITAPFTALMATAIPAATESAQALAQVNAALTSMGPVAGRTSEQLQAAAGHLQDISNFDDDDIMKGVTANLLTFGNVSGKVFDDAQLAIVNISARMGTDLQSAALMVGKALNDPVKGMKALTRAGIQFTDAQKEQIAGMVESGNTAGAQAIMLGELNRQFGRAAKAQRDATPTAAAQQAWRTFQETIGGIALKVLPPFTDMLTKALNAFNNLSPGMQSTAVAVAAIAAAAGPVTAAFGSLLTVGAPLLASFGAEGGFALGLSGLAPILGPLAIAVGAVALAWRNWDSIEPYIEGVVDRVTKGTADINAKLASIQQYADSVDKSMGTPTKAELLDSIGKKARETWTALNSYELAKWAKDTDAAIAKAATDIWQSFEQMHARVQAAFNAMVDGISTVISSRLTAAFDTVKRLTTQAGDAFHTLWDRVVGHSYIPDMVDAIAQHMARLDGVMVKPIAEATKKAGDAFADLKQRANGLLDRLFPEQAELRGKIADLGDIDAMIAAKVGDPAMWAAARARVVAEIDGIRAAADQKQAQQAVPYVAIGAGYFNVQSSAATDAAPAASAATSSATQLQTLLNQLRTSFGDLGSVGNGCFDVITTAIDGGLIPGLGRASDAVGSLGSQMSAMGNAITSLFTSIFGKKTGGIIGGLVNVGLSVFSASQGGGKLPGLADGGVFAVGGSSSLAIGR